MVIGDTYITGEMKNPTPNATPATIDGPTNSATFTLIQVTNSMIGTSAVSNSKIQSGAVTSAKIGSGVQLTGNVCLDSPTICVDSVNDRADFTHTFKIKHNVLMLLLCTRE